MKNILIFVAVFLLSCDNSGQPRYYRVSQKAEDYRVIEVVNGVGERWYEIEYLNSITKRWAVADCYFRSDMEGYFDVCKYSNKTEALKDIEEYKSYRTYYTQTRTVK